MPDMLWKLGQHLIHAQKSRDEIDLGHAYCGLASNIPFCCILHFLECSLIDCPEFARSDSNPPYHRCADCVKHEKAVKISWHNQNGEKSYV
jgi:hypothetical protein